MDDWAIAATTGLFTLAGALLGGWNERRRSREERKEGRQAAREDAVRDALALATLVMDRALPMRFHFSFNPERSPELLKEYEIDWRDAELLLARAYVALPAGDLRDRVNDLRRAGENTLHSLGWVTSMMLRNQDEREMADRAVKCHEKAEQAAAAAIDILNADPG